MTELLQDIWRHSTQISALATAISALTAVLLLIVIRKQMKVESAAAAIGVFETIFRDLNTDAARADRRFIYTCGLRPDELMTNEVARHRADRVCVTLDRIGVILGNRLLPSGPARQLYFDMYVDVFIRCWRCLEGYVKLVRQREKHPQHYRNFEKLAHMAQRYWQRTFPAVDVDPGRPYEAPSLSTGGNPFEQLSTRLIAAPPETWFRIRLDRLRHLPSGIEKDYTIAEIGPSVGVVALDADMQLTLVGQWRWAVQKYSWEIPTGVVEPGETPLDAARRELREEAGLEAADWQSLGQVDNSNGATSDIGHLFLARHLSRVEQHLHGAEDITIANVSLAEAIELTHANQITESLSVAAILKAGRPAMGPN